MRLQAIGQSRRPGFIFGAGVFQIFCRERSNLLRRALAILCCQGVVIQLGYLHECLLQLAVFGSISGDQQLMGIAQGRLSPAKVEQYPTQVQTILKPPLVPFGGVILHLFIIGVIACKSDRRTGTKPRQVR
ncbi:hypothetical protein D3C80_365110 [compost metagenome]